MVSPVPNYSDARRAVIVQLLRESDAVKELTEDALLVYVVLALIVDDEGLVAEELLSLALADRSIVQAANTLIEKAR